MGHTKKIFFNIKRRLLYSHVHPGLKVMKK
jgi:hypothetical protein